MACPEVTRGLSKLFREQSKLVSDATQTLRQQLKRDPTDEELARETGLTTEKLARMRLEKESRISNGYPWNELEDREAVDEHIDRLNDYTAVEQSLAHAAVG